MTNRESFSCGAVLDGPGWGDSMLTGSVVAVVAVRVVASVASAASAPSLPPTYFVWLVKCEGAYIEKQNGKLLFLEIVFFLLFLILLF